MREAPKVRWVGLVRADDPEYLAAMSAQALAHRRLGPRQDPGDVYRASSLAEAAVRAWLGARLALLEERVLVADLLPLGRRSYERRYLELDAIEGADGVPTRIIEVKFSANPSALRRGLAQLDRARALLAHGWHDLATLLVLVEANRSGVELDLERLRDMRLITADELGSRDGAGPDLLVLPLLALATHLDEAQMAIIERGRDEGQELTDRRAERALAEASGETLPERERDARGGDGPGQSLAFGDAPEAGDSPFAALRGFVDDEPGDAPR